MISRANHSVSNKRVIVLSLLFILCINIFITETAFSDLINPKKTNPPTPIYPPTEPITPPENPTPNPIYPPPNPTPNPTPAPEPNSCQPGSSETYQCVDNKVQQLYDRNCPTEHWATIKDCSQCGDPPCQCVGGVCVHMPGPNPPVNPKDCDQQACQAQNQKIGVPYTKDGTSYQKYKDCNCKDGECQCESIDKEIPSECQDIKFQGEVVDTGVFNWDTTNEEGGGSYLWWKVHLTNSLSGPQPKNDPVYVIEGVYRADSTSSPELAKGQIDKSIVKGDKVEVYGCYHQDGDSVSLAEKDYYYIKKVAADCSNPPTLSDAKVNPDCGPENCEFTFSVVYKDPDGGEPTTANIWIQGWEGTNTIPVYNSGYINSMIKEDPNADITKGATYYYKVKLPAKGDYHYIIYFVSKKGCRVDLPLHGFSDNLGLPGPRVDSGCPGTPENKPENYEYVVSVKDSAGNPIAGAEVNVDGNKMDMQTDSNGELRVQLPDASHTATATKTDVGTGTWSGALDHKSDKGFTIIIPTESKPFEAKSGKLTIKVIDRNNNPIYGADVIIYNSDTVILSGATDKDGQVETDVKFGKYKIKVSADCGSDIIEYVFEKDVDKATIKLDSCFKSKKFTVRVIDALEKPVSGAYIWIDDNLIDSTRDNGELEIEVPIQEQHSIRAQAHNGLDILGEASTTKDFQNENPLITLQITSLPQPISANFKGTAIMTKGKGNEKINGGSVEFFVKDKVWHARIVSIKFEGGWCTNQGIGNAKYDSSKYILQIEVKREGALFEYGNSAQYTDDLVAVTNGEKYDCQSSGNVPFAPGFAEEFLGCPAELKDIPIDYDIKASGNYYVQVKIMHNACETDYIKSEVKTLAL